MSVEASVHELRQSTGSMESDLDELEHYITAMVADLFMRTRTMRKEARSMRGELDYVIDALKEEVSQLEATFRGSAGDAVDASSPALLAPSYKIFGFPDSPTPSTLRLSARFAHIHHLPVWCHRYLGQSGNTSSLKAQLPVNEDDKQVDQETVAAEALAGVRGEVA